MINGSVYCFPISTKPSECCSTEVMESLRGRVKGFGEEVMVAAAGDCCHSEHSAESHWLSAGETGNGMQGVKEGTGAEGVRYIKEMWLIFVPQEEKSKQKLKSTLD